MGRIFGGRSKLERAEQALARGNYAEALLLAEEASPGEGEDSRREVVLQAAADGLARLNLEEGERLFAAGDAERGCEHLQLALQQVRSADLRETIARALESSVAAETAPVPVVPRQVASGCGGCGGGHPHAQEVSLPLSADMESQFELILAAYPVSLQQRYREHSDDFRQALLLANAGEDRQALDLWLRLAESERDALYCFELGSLYGRLGELDHGIEHMRQSLRLDSRNLLAVDALAELLLAAGRTAEARELLRELLERGEAQGYCHARLCELSYSERDEEAALAAARKALAVGFAEPGFLLLAAQLLERAGDAGLAEKLLAALPGGGCGGGINLHLAEFWLRQKRDLGKVLDAFNGACRQEPDNPRWQLRVAQTYLARDWRKQGFELLRKVVGDPRLDESLRLEAKSLLEEAQHA